MKKMNPNSDSPHDCSEDVTVAGNSVMGSEDNRCDRNYRRPGEDESLMCLMKKAGFGSNYAVNGNFGSGQFASGKRMVPPSFASKVKSLSSEESMELLASQTRKRRHSDSSQGKVLHVEKHRDERQTNLLPVMRQNRTHDVLTPREKVLKTIRLFWIIFEDLNKEKSARFATTQIDRYTRDILVREGKQVNGEKRVGVVPGVEVGDQFNYKSQLSLIGLHFDMSRGIDYMYMKGLKIATSVVISEDAAYNDIWRSDRVTYCGEGDYLKTKSPKGAKDQTMTKGNLALANSMREKKQVRLIIGRLHQRKKQYVYVGLYSVEDYWDDIGPLGNKVFKFKLVRRQASL